MESPAEQLWSAKTRGILDFEPIEPIKDVMPVGGVFCSPFEHFALLRSLRTTSLDVRDATLGDVASLADNQTVFIVGGGGLITPGGGGFSLVEYTACKVAKCILWSIGTNARSYDLRNAMANADRLRSDYRAISHNRGTGAVKPLPGVLLAGGRDFGVQLPEP